MNKKTAIALAVGAVFATPVLAQTGSGVEIYGRLYPQVQWNKGEGATVGAPPSNLVGSGSGGNHDGRLAVETQNSRIGFRGREMLGGGLNAIWQIETRTRFDTGSGNPWAGGRNSFLGMSGGFGTVKLGNMDTIYKEYGGQVGNFFGISSGNFVSSSNILTESGLGPDDNGSYVGFNIRAPNTIQYETPEFGSFQAGLQYAPDEAKGNPTVGSRNASLLSAGVKYEAGPLYASIQHERHNDAFEGSANVAVPNGGATATGSSRDTATRLSLGFSVTSQHKITGDIARMEWKESGQTAAGQFESYDKITWGIGWEARWGGPWRTEITYLQGNDGDCTLSGGGACSTSGLKSSQINAGVAYSLSKRTLVYSLFAKHKTGASALYDPATFSTNRGEDATLFAVGMSHSF